MSIVVLGILISIAIPALSGVRERAQEAKTLSNLRTSGQVFARYASVNDEVWPFLTDPNRPLDDHTAPTLRERVGFFGAETLWAWLLADAGYSNITEITTNHGDDRGYLYSPTAFTRPDYWNRLTRRGDATQWRPTRVGEVRYPTLKGIVWRETGAVELLYNGPGRGAVEAWIPDGASVNFADGRADTYPLASLRAPYPFGAGDPRFPGDRISQFGLFIAHTTDGVHGRDLN